MFLLVSILTETCPLVTNLTGTDPVSTRWSPPGLLIGVVLKHKLSGSLSVWLPAPAVADGFDYPF